MATALQAEEKLSLILRCPICLESLTKPKVLLCGHAYCASCLQSHINTNVTQSKDTQACFPCPVCKTDTMLADPNICIEQCAESFRVNSIASALIDATGRTKEGNKCSQCMKQGKETLATCFCKECDQHMCISCKKYHDGFPSLSRHYVTNVSDNTDCFVKPDISEIEICQRHSGKRIKLFCEDHNILCCSLCVTLEHRKCEYVVTIEDVLKSFDVRKKSEEIKLNMVNFEDHINKLLRMLKSNLDKLQKDKDAIMENIQSLKTQVMAKLQELEDNIIQTLEREYKSEDSNLQSQDIKGRGLITAIKNDQIQLDLVATHGSEVQKVILLHNLDHNKTRYSAAISDYQNEIRDVNICFEVDETLSKFVNTISELGKINFFGKHVGVSSACLQTAKTLFQPHSINPPIAVPLKEKNAVQISTFNVSTSRDNDTCHISHILILKDTRMLLVDQVNCKVKLFEQDYKCKEAMKFENYPWFACSLADTEVAVTIPKMKTIQIIEVDDVMRKKMEIVTRYECWGIAVVKDQLVITTRGHLVLILDMEGREIRAVHTNNYHSEKNVRCNFIKADISNSAMYISYENSNKLVAYSMNWDVLFTYTNPEFRRPSGMDIDKEGNIYLCGFDSHCVHQISAEGQHIKTLISKETEKMRPLNIVYVKHTDSFFVTYYNCDFVEVYELCISQK